jgi:alkanesulfonate monooxygenase SsuD/methylene tetrahydromethanopterin reductase-like flavin-dependent oxidoreductase (luciferase family)
MVKVILQIYPTVPAKDEAERIALRPIGRNAERYNEALMGSFDLVRAADEMGVWGVASIEHHFHSEGYEVGPHPGLLGAYWAAITKRIRIGQLGYVMSAQHPIRVAEETAILDHMTQGRSFVGFARGYQDRWTHIIGQHLGTKATHSDGSENDRINRRIFQEQVEMVIRAWTEESIDHNSDLWQIPMPYDEGIDWWMSESTKRLGARGEIGEDDRVHRVSVVPSPYTKPHPPVFVASLGSDESIDFCGRNGFVVTHITGGKLAHEQAPRYVAAAKEGGFDFAPGQNQGVQRFLQIGATPQKTREQLAAWDAEIYMNFYNQIYQAIVPIKALPRDADRETVIDALEHGAGGWITGTVEEARAKLVAEWKNLPAEYIVVTWHYAQQPKEAVIEQLGIFMKEIKPALDELTPYESDA